MVTKWAYKNVISFLNYLKTKFCKKYCVLYNFIKNQIWNLKEICLKPIVFTLIMLDYKCWIQILI